MEVRTCRTVEEMQACVDLQATVWGFKTADLIPRRLFVVASRIGGQVLGAWDGERLAGFALALPGVNAAGPYLHSHMLAVDEPYRNAGLGRRLKLAQREDALGRGIDMMEWTFDPLELKNAFFNIVRLGAIMRRYTRNFYGTTSSALQAGLPTDRLHAEWWMRSPRVERAIAAGGSSGEMAEQVMVPWQVAEWKAHEDTRELAREQQARIGGELEAAFTRGLAVMGFHLDADGNGVYELGPEEVLEVRS